MLELMRRTGCNPCDLGSHIEGRLVYNPHYLEATVMRLTMLALMGKPMGPAADFLFRPGNAACDHVMEDGDARMEREHPERAPVECGTRRVTFGDMVERDQYLHCARSVRRDGKRKDTRNDF